MDTGSANDKRLTSGGCKVDTNLTSMSILYSVGPKCTLAASHAAAGESQTDTCRDGQKDDARPLHYALR